ncbi:hypothetical protein chiPu_0005211 [Chiloscyllium punctatum]|uniref:Uncharacterized protein n=1 Tax=Chiloscyllium punctatum TaxID=137246 RepID=A0A401S8R9_CHIPU|nr:hypothetical protein [Chiloscyllium punctatum]
MKRTSPGSIPRCKTHIRTLQPLLINDGSDPAVYLFVTHSVETSKCTACIYLEGWEEEEEDRDNMKFNGKLWSPRVESGRIDSLSDWLLLVELTRGDRACSRAQHDVWKPLNRARTTGNAPINEKGAGNKAFIFLADVDASIEGRSVVI